MENERSGKSLSGLLKDFSTKHQTKMLVFNDENNLFNFLKDNRRLTKDFMHYIVLFNLKPPLDNVLNVVNKIKEDSNLKSTPVFLMTSSIEDEDVMKAYKCHVNCYLTKPEDVEGLIYVLDSFKELWLNLAKLP